MRRPLLIALVALIVLPAYEVATEQIRARFRVMPVQAQGGTIPAGLIAYMAEQCPTGWVEYTAANGKTVLGTLAANANVTGTGGNDTVTPTGTNTDGAVSAHAGTAVNDHGSHSHTYTEVPNHTHAITITDNGHSHVETNNSATTGGLTGWAAQDTSTNTASVTGYSTQSATTGITAASANPGGGVATGTTAGPSATLTHTVTQPSAHTFTNPTWTGDSVDNRSAFIRLIACQKQ